MASLSITSSAFFDGGKIPKKYGYKNQNLSPPLTISGVPTNTKSLAIIMDDPDAMAAVGKLWVHWVIWNISPIITDIKESETPSGSVLGVTDFGEKQYGGPAPPDREHTYHFKLYALDTTLDLPSGSNKKQLEEKMQRHIIEEAVLKGKYTPDK